MNPLSLLVPGGARRGRSAHVVGLARATGSARLHRAAAEAHDDERRERIADLATAAGPVILVSNAVSLGLVPKTPSARAFRETQRRLNQAVAAAVPRGVVVAGGRPLVLQGG